MTNIFFGSCRFDNIADIFPLIESCCCNNTSCFSMALKDDNSLLPNVVPQVYDLKQLQDDITAEILSKFRRLKPVSSISMNFSFKNVQESVTAIL